MALCRDEEDWRGDGADKPKGVPRWCAYGRWVAGLTAAWRCSRGAENAAMRGAKVKCKACLDDDGTGS